MYVNIHLLHASVAISRQKPGVFSSFVQCMRELDMSNWYAVLFLSFKLYYVLKSALSGTGSFVLVEMHLYVLNEMLSSLYSHFMNVIYLFKNLPLKNW